MSIGQTESFQGNKIEILEMILKNTDNQLELSWEIYFDNAVYRMTFYNVSRFRVGDLSTPLEVHGFEIINHSQNGWEKDSKYEIRDFEDDCVNFFCECFKTERQGTVSVKERQGTVLCLDKNSTEGGSPC